MKPYAVTDLNNDGFKGYFFTSKEKSDKCLIVLLGDKGNDFLSLSFAKWITKVQKCNALCIGIEQENNSEHGLHNWKIEYAESAVKWLNSNSIKKIGIIGLSMGAAMALVSASFIADISLVIALSPCDFIPWGFYQGRLGKSSNAEWPSETSSFSWRGEELPFQPAMLKKEDYWNMYLNDRKKYKEIHTRNIFDYSERHSPITKDKFIKVENIKGKLVIAAAEDDSMWNSLKYTERIENRLKEKKADNITYIYKYKFGTHLIVPESLLKGAVPLFGDLITKMYVSGKTHSAECKQSRTDLDTKISPIIKNW